MDLRGKQAGQHCRVAARTLLQRSALLAVVLLAACGYRFPSERQPLGRIDTIAVTLVENRSVETGLDLLLTDYLKDEVIQRAPARISEPRAAAAVLSGVITAVRTMTVSRKNALSTRERRVSVRVDLVLKGSDGGLLWSGSGLKADETYLVVAADRGTTDENRRRALSRAAKRVAETAFYRMTSDF